MDQGFGVSNLQSNSLFDVRTIAEASFRLRQQRRSVFGPEICSSPAMDLLLMMFLSPTEGLTAAVATTTLQLSENQLYRWLCILKDRGLVEGCSPENRDIFYLTEIGQRAVAKSCDLLTVNG